MTEDAEPGDLPLVARDVRLTGTALRAPDRGRPWTGVRTPFGGLLDPGVAAGDWPPAVLSFLTLAPLLADALGGTARSPAGPAAPTTAGAEDEPRELTVREVIRETDAARSGGWGLTDTPAPSRPEPDRHRPRGRAGTGRPGPDELDAPATGDRPFGTADDASDGLADDAADGVVDAASVPPGGGEPPGDASGGGLPELAVWSRRPPRTVLRRLGRGAAAAPGPVRRTITRLIEARDIVDTGTAPGETSGREGAVVPAADRATDEAVAIPPVERTMPALPPELGAAAGAMADSGAPDVGDLASPDRTVPGSSPSAPATRPRRSMPGATGGSGDETSGTGSERDMPAMSVRREPAETGGRATTGSDLDRGPTPASGAGRRGAASTRAGEPGAPPGRATGSGDLRSAELTDRTATGSRPSATAGDRPTMTVLRSAAEGGSRTEAGSGAPNDAPGVSATNTGRPPGEAPGAAGFGAGVRSGGTPRSTASRQRGAAGAAVDEVADSAERAVLSALDAPRVIDRLYRAIERRQRIERERRGRR